MELENLERKIVSTSKRHNGMKLVELDNSKYCIIGKDSHMIFEVSRSKSIQRWYNLIPHL